MSGSLIVAGSLCPDRLRYEQGWTGTHTVDSDLKGAGGVDDGPAEGGNGGSELAEVVTVPIDEYEAMVAELDELRPLRSDLRMISGIAGRHRD
jgi:hypothetical protein